MIRPRSVRAGCAWAAVAVILTGCSSADSDDPAPEAASPPAAGATAGASKDAGATAGASKDAGATAGASKDAGATDGSTGAVAPASPTASPGLPQLGAHGDQSDVLARLPGKDTGCVAVGAERDVRSGSFAAGPFDTASSEAGSGSVRLYFIPRHAGRMPGVRVTGRNLATGETFARRQRTVADAGRFQLYDLQVPAARGSWEITAVAGRDRGCWSVDLG
ncbi:hypothetical protein [Nocardioides sp. URHA0020]|uniref:hypothetical protein n=1 Tax=Nocardioides sp. URHA0020 TaxID=1380392 RepID=UPI0018CC68E4|nr:hypothetical protein [Nocardioides sp. URHA0020]